METITAPTVNASMRMMTATTSPAGILTMKTFSVMMIWTENLMTIWMENLTTMTCSMMMIHLTWNSKKTMMRKMNDHLFPNRINIPPGMRISGRFFMTAG